MLKRTISILILVSSALICAKDIIIEVKGAGFVPTNCLYKNIYGSSGMYGIEGTFNLGCKHLYGFISLDFLNKKGHSIGLCTPTKINLFELGLGVKYLVPFCRGDAYVGLGILPTHAKTRDCSEYVVYKHKAWDVGGIAKFGALFDLCRNVVLDLFVNYTFVSVSFSCTQSSNCTQAATGYVQSNKAHLNAAIIGAGLGYRFN